VLLILHKHVVQDDTTYHNIANSIKVPCSTRILDYLPMCLEYTKCPLNVLPRCALHLREVFSLLTLGRVYRLDEATPLRINAIYE
jgi:hypothetical protein